MTDDDPLLESARAIIDEISKKRDEAQRKMADLFRRKERGEAVSDYDDEMTQLQKVMAGAIYKLECVGKLLETSTDPAAPKAMN